MFSTYGKRKELLVTGIGFVPGKQLRRTLDPSCLVRVHLFERCDLWNRALDQGCEPRQSGRPSKETEAIRDRRQHIHRPSEMPFRSGNYVMPVHLVVERPSIDAQDLGGLALISAYFLKHTDNVVPFNVTEASYELFGPSILACDQTG